MNYRQEQLLDFLHARDFVTPEAIFMAIQEYEEYDDHGYQSARKKRLSYDVRELNNDPNVPVIICSTRRGGYKIGTKEEAERYIKNKKRDAIKMLNSAQMLERKLGRNGQYKFENEEISRNVAVLEGEEK